MGGKKKREREEACYICGHFHDYEGGEPCSTCGHKLVPTNIQSPSMSAFPTEIIPGFLYLGSYDNAARLELLKALGVTHILNTVPSCQALYKNSFTYLTVASTPPDFEECFRFLETVKDAQQRVLVHCMSGKARSPTVVIGYLMKLRKWRLAESYKWVKDRRPDTQISEDDARRLQGLEVQLLGSSSTGFLQAGAQQSGQQPQGSVPAGPFNWTSWRDAPQPHPPAFLPTASLSFVGTPVGPIVSAAPPSSFVFGAQPATNGSGSAASADEQWAMES
ncbi:hypothetical protein WJX72_007127 [[Myrmecia] bisecta]|uniref:Uncharacterized protein n=1 Tax=[Myrmecia] bisecta TaxID=41462 RepID=A0AAW1QAT0_9CHLO